MVIVNAPRNWRDWLPWHHTYPLPSCSSPSIRSGTSSIGKHLLANTHIAKLNQLTESEVSELTGWMVDETAVAILKRQGSQGITIVCSQRKMIFHIHIDLYWPKWRTTRSKLSAKEFETSEFYQDMWHHYLLLRFVSAHIPCNTILNRELQWSYKPLRNDLVLPSTTTLSNIGRREYALTVDAINEQLPSCNKVSLALNGGTSPNKRTTT